MTLSGPADEQLAVMAAGGSEAAADLLLARYKDTVRIKARLYYILGADRDDVVQEGMIGLFKAIESYDPSRGASFRTYAELCISRRILTAVRSAGRKKNSPLNDALSLDTPVYDADDSPTLGESLSAGSAGDPEADFIFRELSENLLSEDSRLLSPLERQVLALLLEGMDYRSIAAGLGKSPKQTDNAIQRIRTKLRNYLQQ